MPKYADDPLWADVIPIPQDDGGPNPLAAIAYTDAYSEAMSYLRAVMADNEISERALALTADIIAMNPAHYTVWIYRTRLLKDLPSANLRGEVSWLNQIAFDNLKNYQIWNHRQFLLDTLDDPTGEIAFVNSMLDKDAKNYHVWSYRQWLVRRFQLWHKAELNETERLIDDDVRNNSPWNHRFFLVNARDDDNAHNESQTLSGVRDPLIRKREIAFATDKIALAQQNQSPWLYLKGTLRKANVPLSSVKDFCQQYATLDQTEHVTSRHALDLLAEIYALERTEPTKQLAARAYDLLATKYDPIRANYWNYRKVSLVV